MGSREPGLAVRNRQFLIKSKAARIDLTFPHCLCKRTAWLTPMSAQTYVASFKEDPLLPYQWYKASVVAGAIEHDLPFEYIEWLRTFESQPDANAKRGTEREALIFGDLPLHRFEFERGRRQAAVNEV